MKYIFNWIEGVIKQANLVERLEDAKLDANLRLSRTMPNSDLLEKYEDYDIKFRARDEASIFHTLCNEYYLAKPLEELGFIKEKSNQTSVFKIENNKTEYCIKFNKLNKKGLPNHEKSRPRKSFQENLNIEELNQGNMFIDKIVNILIGYWYDKETSIDWRFIIPNGKKDAYISESLKNLEILHTNEQENFLDKNLKESDDLSIVAKQDKEGIKLYKLEE